MRIVLGILFAVLMAGSALAMKPFEGEGLPFQANGFLNNTTDVSLKAATTNVTHCVTQIQVSTLATLGSDQVVRLLSNDTVIWQWALDQTVSGAGASYFPVPVCAVRGEALEIDVSADPTDSLVVYGVQGYSYTDGQ